MDNPLLYNRQQELHLSIPNSVTVAGCGGIGFHVAKGLAMVGVSNLYLFDTDVMEESNRGRIDVCESSLNRPKVDVIAEHIQALRPACNVVAIKNKLEDVFLEIQLQVSNVVVDCTDSPRSQFKIYNACKSKGVRYVRAGYNGEHMTVTGHISGWVKSATDQGEEQANYTVNPSCYVTAVIPAMLAVWKIIHSDNQEVSCNITDIGVDVVMRQDRLGTRCNQAGSTQDYQGRVGRGRIRTGREALR
jgi:molybdopterin/thiamine biosynthesis adenylyltransferase